MPRNNSVTILAIPSRRVAFIFLLLPDADQRTQFYSDLHSITIELFPRAITRNNQWALVPISRATPSTRDVTSVACPNRYVSRDRCRRPTYGQIAAVHRFSFYTDRDALREGSRRSGVAPITP